MAVCAACKSTILFGGVKSGPLRFCSERCAGSNELARLLGSIPEAEALARAQAIQSGRCPLCQGPGPIDVHHSHRVWSAVFMTRWEDRPRLSCRRCARKRAFGDLIFSFFLGWWGIPFGLLMTPITLLRNLFGLLAVERPGKRPSAELLYEARNQLAHERLRSAQAPPGKIAQA